jgi:hypothetical protein
MLIKLTKQIFLSGTARLLATTALIGVPCISFAEGEMRTFDPESLYTSGTEWDEIYSNQYAFYFYPDDVTDNGTAVIGYGEDDDSGYEYNFYWDTVTGDVKERLINDFGFTWIAS